MRLNKLLVGLLGLTLLATAASGCVIRTRGRAHVAYTVDAGPPPARVVYVDHRPGWVYIDGYYYWTGYDWAWQEGYWEPERAGYFYVQGTWVTHGGRHHWKPGHWARGNNTGGHWQHGANGGYVHKANHGVRVREHGPAHHGGGHGSHKVKVKVKENKRGTTIKVREHR